jgi:hypothetical protein
MATIKANKLIVVIGLAALLSMPRAKAQTGNAQPSAVGRSDGSSKVTEVMKRAIARDYSKVDGNTPDGKPIRGVTRISWVPPDLPPKNSTSQNQSSLVI